MKYNDKNVANCFYSDGITNYIINYYPDENFDIAGDLPFIPLDNEGHAFILKSVVLPGKEKIILCSFSFVEYFYCYQYDISLNMILYQKKIKDSSSYFPEQQYVLLEYFAETDEILLGYTFYSNIIYIIQCTRDLQCTDMKEIKDFDYEIIGYPNIVIPSGKNNYYFLNYHDIYSIDCPNGDNCGKYLFQLNISNNETLVCSAHNYSNYYHSECLTSVLKVIIVIVPLIEQ